MPGWSTSAGERTAWVDLLSCSCLFLPCYCERSLGERHGVFPRLVQRRAPVSGVVPDVCACDGVCGHSVGWVVDRYGKVPLFGWTGRNVAAKLWPLAASVYSISCAGLRVLSPSPHGAVANIHPLLSGKDSPTATVAIVHLPLSHGVFRMRARPPLYYPPLPSHS